ncbi:chaperonin 10-like protein [Xylariales sp. PMI_506]|nr:chaperonin 10-like protein [Xylariales sp. PMI_506]
MAELPTVMKAVVFEGPRKVSVQDRPVPQLQHEQDIIVKVQMTALCGSELHSYRGLEPSGSGFIMGHEFTGIVVAAGSAVKTVQLGDKVVTPFTTSCGDCYYCSNACSSRCTKNQLFGSERLDGGQAEYVRIPLADGTVVKAPSTISDQALILMGDIFPTGFYGVKSAINMSPGLNIRESTIVVVGCGPVGLCAIVSAAAQQPRHLFAVDSVPSRLEQAKKLGAEALNFATMDKAAMQARIHEVTEGRGADMVVEVVGLAPALRTAYDLVRPFGVISSVGVHNSDLPWSGSEGYDKNVRLQMGRCPVRSIFPEALALLEQKENLFSFMYENVMPLADAPNGYQLFDKMAVQKVIFKP